MTELLGKIALLIALTHGIRALSRLAGPKRGGLVLGLPSTTAVALVGCGQAVGVAGAIEMAEASLQGLAAAATLPLAFARALAWRRRLAWSVAAAVAAYFTVAWGSALLPDVGPVGQVATATCAVLAACRCAGRISTAESTTASSAPSGVSCLLLRTAIPALCLAAVTALRELGGLRWAGLFSTFPGMTLAVLIVTYLESSPADAGRMARSLPSANLGMVAFIAAFRFGIPTIGLGWGTAAGYAVAVLTLLVVGWWPQRQRLLSPPRPAQVVRLNGHGPPRTSSLGSRLSWAASPPRSAAVRRPARRRSLALRVEPIGF